jgi:hypothetical protein
VAATGLLAVTVIISAVVAMSGTHRTNTPRLTVTLLASSSTLNNAPPRDEIAPNGAGWALTTKGLEITTDGGASFVLVSTPVPVATIGDVSFGGNAIVLAGWKDFKPWVEYSSNIGASWTNVQLPQGIDNAGGVQLVADANTVVGMLVTDVTSSNFSAGEWYSTSDGGLTWSHHSAPSGGTVTTSKGVLWLVGGPETNRLFESTDSGTSWSTVPLPAAINAEGAALSSPRSFSNGELVLVAQTPTSNSGSTYGLSVFLSSDHGASWTLSASTTLPGSIGIGVNSTTAVSSKVLWIGSSGGTPHVIQFEEGRGFSDTSSIGSYQEGFVSALSDLSETSLWATVQDGVCPSGKSSCMQVGTLSMTRDGGRSWSPVNLTPVSGSPS